MVTWMRVCRAEGEGADISKKVSFTVQKRLHRREEKEKESS